jgi:rhodanese-related sulfurtransferase/predicted metal-dependent enzyme (double-stranded beta helix superfamily)
MASLPSAIAEPVQTPTQLAELVAQLTADPARWVDRVRFCADRRWYERLQCTPEYDVWLITWLPGQATGLHDHGPSSGAFAVASGVLEEHRPGQPALLLDSGELRTFGEGYAHDVRNNSMAPAISIHAYSPPLTTMNHFEIEGAAVTPETEGRDRAGERSRATATAGAVEPGSTGIERMLSAARGRLRRLSPDEAFAAIHDNDDAVLVDIRPAAQRADEGQIPGAVIIERNVLEWRLDPASAARLAVARGYDVPIIVFCSEGYTSSLAAASLQELGLWRATDIVGGFRAWHSAGLPASS